MKECTIQSEITFGERTFYRNWLTLERATNEQGGDGQTDRQTDHFAVAVF